MQSDGAEEFSHLAEGLLQELGIPEGMDPGSVADAASRPSTSRDAPLPMAPGASAGAGTSESGGSSSALPGPSNPRSTAQSQTREQDRLLPLANVVQLMASELPEEAKISHNAKMWMQEMVSEMVFFVTSEAIDRSSLSGDRRVISSEDLNASLRSLGVPSSLPRSLAGFGRSRSLSALSSRCLSLSHALHLRVRRSRHSPRGVWQLSWRERRTTARGGDGTPPADADERADGATTAPAPRPPLSPCRPPPLRAEAPVRHRTRAVYGAQRAPI